MKPIITIFIMLCLCSSACSPVAQVAPVPEMPDAATTPTFIHAPALTPIALATATLPPTIPPTITPTLDSFRRTPPTLMLHRPNLQFDSLAFLKDFIQILKQNNMRVVTYRDIQENPQITATEQGRLFIITIDDISLAYPMNQHVIEMTEALQEAGYPAVLGVVTATDYPDPDTVARLKELSDSGWEIASHTDKHANLGKLEKASENLVVDEVTPSLDKLEKTIGIRPITLILPEGQMINDIGILQKMGLSWVVGINGGLTFDSRDETVYVGREGPAKNAEYTLKIMKKRFGFWLQASLAAPSLSPEKGRCAREGKMPRSLHYFYPFAGRTGRCILVCEEPMKHLIQSAWALVRENQRAYIVINIVYYGLVIIFMVVAAFNRPLQDMLLEAVGAAFMTGPLAVVGNAYINAEVLKAIALTFVVNLVIGSFLYITLPSLVIPFIGFVLGIYRAALWGLLFYPGHPDIGMIMLPHSITLILEGQAYILALFGVYLQGRAFLWPKSVGLETRGQGYAEGLKRTGKIYILVVLTLAIAAIYEVIEVVLMAQIAG